MKAKQVEQPKAEEDILKTIIEKESWEDVIYYIVGLEQLNPWDVDLTRLTESFLKFAQSVKDLDFRIPAKVVFVAAILLRLKADYLSIFEEEEDDEVEKMLKEEKPFAELGIDPNLVQLGYPMRRVPKRQVTLEELISALRSALEVRERKEERVKVLRGQLNVNLPHEEEDMTIRTEKMLKEIDGLMQKLHQDKIEFGQIVKEWKRDKVIEKFIPMLHLEHDGKISSEQEDFFKKILISKKTLQSKN
ncbi:MAG: segregation/condensation protein A [Candidatus Aenigmarchaeota archaeon]|nr:segregation/condensation protein A [Candidatus Aenigmarchaeota archaeon]